jgi:hypothetical protein
MPRPRCLLVVHGSHSKDVTMWMGDVDLLWCTLRKPRRSGHQWSPRKGGEGQGTRAEPKTCNSIDRSPTLNKHQIHSSPPQLLRIPVSISLAIREEASENFLNKSGYDPSTRPHFVTMPRRTKAWAVTFPDAPPVQVQVVRHAHLAGWAMAHRRS